MSIKKGFLHSTAEPAPSIPEGVGMTIKDSKGVPRLKDDARVGGQIAGSARKQIERKIQARYSF